MLLVLFVILNLSILTIANPFHKYPFVFLLDVGNEELQNTNAEQIRVSIPGGSLAMRYPAIGDGDTITHVRVSGIDFGTDLKADIYDGGPGYKYVVIVFMGNKGVPYDSVVTIQTLPDNQLVNYVGSLQNTDNVNPSDDTEVQNVNEVDDNSNDSAENDSEPQYSQKTNAELMQSSSNVYNYAQNEYIENDDDQGGSNNDYDFDNSDDSDDDKDIHKSYGIPSASQEFNTQNVNVKDYNEDDVYSDDNNEQNNDVKVEKYSSDYDGEQDDDSQEEQVKYVDSNLYAKYYALRPYLYNNVRLYPQQYVPVVQNVQQNYKQDYREEGELDQMFNDEEIHNDAQKYKDSNNNFYDTDDSSAVAY